VSKSIGARLFAAGAVLVLGGCVDSPGAGPEASARLSVPPVRVPANGWAAEKQARHALDRLAYGPRPGEAEEIARTGVEKWIRDQMAPADLEDAATEVKLKGLPTLAMTVPALLRAFPRPQDLARRNGFVEDGAEAREKLKELIPPETRPAVIEQQLAAAKLVRAVESRRQLQEVLVDFWFNHFNVFDGKGEDRWMVGAYERDAIRPLVFGSFRDLLEATASHPAMLFYLDNWTSTWDGAREKQGSGSPRRGGINENYARELLELHTLGVNGGYTEGDVREVARCFTGWSIVPPRAASVVAKGPAAGLEPGTFVFRPRAHDPGEKRVLGTVIPAGGGRRDAEIVLDLLARHPSTARFVATKLCRRFVADDPPGALVARVASVFMRTGGDLRSVYAAIFSSPELWSDEAYRAKTKTPLELAASSVRALGGDVDPARAMPLARQVALMGQPLYKCQPPTGWADVAEAWLSAGVLVNRLSFGVALAAGRIPGVTGDPSHLARGAPDPVRAAALALGAPAFQKK
jgi:uncharacterized protein (DUF1800 family)